MTPWLGKFAVADCFTRLWVVEVYNQETWIVPRACKGRNKASSLVNGLFIFINTFVHPFPFCPPLSTHLITAFPSLLQRILNFSSVLLPSTQFFVGGFSCFGYCSSTPPPSLCLFLQHCPFIVLSILDTHSLFLYPPAFWHYPVSLILTQPFKVWFHCSCFQDPRMLTWTADGKDNPLKWVFIAGVY